MVNQHGSEFRVHAERIADAILSRRRKRKDALVCALADALMVSGAVAGNQHPLAKLQFPSNGSRGFWCHAGGGCRSKVVVEVAGGSMSRWFCIRHALDLASDINSIVARCIATHPEALEVRSDG